MYVGIDPGTRNLAWCIIDEDKHTMETGVYDMGKGKHNEIDMAWHVEELYYKLVGKCGRMPTDVVIERQMMRKYALVCQSIVQAFISHDGNIRVQIVSASSVKTHFGMPLAGHAANKKNAIVKAEHLTGKKLTDHEADAYLTALFAVHMTSGCMCSAKSNHTKYFKLPCQHNSFLPMVPLLPQAQSSISSTDLTDKDKDSRPLPSLPEKSRI